MDWSAQRVLVTGASGFLGRAVVAALRARGLPSDRLLAPSRAECDLLDPAPIRRLVTRDGAGLTHIIHCAGLVGGLGLNRDRPADMLAHNLRMALNLVDAATLDPAPHARRVLTLVGSMTSYPADAPLPYREGSLFRGLPDPEIASYGVGKLAALALLRAAALQFRLRAAFPIPSNLYGPGDRLDDARVSHVAGALIKRFTDAADSAAPEVVGWGTGAPTRDFLYIDDAAEGVLRAAEHADDHPSRDPLVVNLASGREVSIRDLAQTIARLAGFTGRITWDAAKGDGVSRRCLDISRARDLLGWSPRTDLDAGLARTIAWYRASRR